MVDFVWAPSELVPHLFATFQATGTENLQNTNKNLSIEIKLSSDMCECSEKRPVVVVSGIFPHIF